MLPRARDLRKLWFEWPESRFGRFNFQREEHMLALSGHLTSDTNPAVVALIGEPGIGRGYLCEAVVDRVRKPGRKVALWSIDLAGFEPEVANPLDEYLRQLVEEHERAHAERRDQAKGAAKSAAKSLSKLDLVGQASDVAALLLSLVWQFEDPLQRFAEMLEAPRQGGVPPRDDPTSLNRFLSELTADRQLLVHVRDGAGLADDTLRLLIREAERAPERLLLLVSFTVPDAAERLERFTRHPAPKIILEPLDRPAVRATLDRGFAPHRFPDELVELLHRRTHGRPPALANLVADLVDAELISEDEGVWRLPREGTDSPELVRVVSRSLYDEVDRRLTEEEPETRRLLEAFLLRAALCGPFFPAAALLESLRLDEEAGDTVIDWMDDVMVDEIGWLADLGFRHPSFAGRSVYRFTHQTLPLVVLDQLSKIDREGEAALLLRFFEERLPVATRGVARMFLAIAEHLSEKEREPWRRRLEWWVRLEELDGLRARMTEDIREGRLDPELVWSMAKSSEGRSVHLRLALMKVYFEAVTGVERLTVPPGKMLYTHYLFSQLLFEAGSYDAALHQADMAKEIAPCRTRSSLIVLNLIGTILCAKGSFLRARKEFEGAAVLSQEILSRVDPLRAAIHYGLGCVMDAQGAVNSAYLEFTRVLVMLCPSDPKSPLVLAARHSLVKIFISKGEFYRAIRQGRALLALQVHHLGPKHPHTVKTSQSLATARLCLGDYETACQDYKSVLEIQCQSSGPGHVDTLITRQCLARAHFMKGDYREARRESQQVVSICDQSLGPEHPLALKARSCLAEALEGLGDYKSSRRQFEFVLDVRKKFLGQEHPDTISTRHALAGVLASQGDFSRASEEYEAVWQWRCEHLGPEHPDSLVARHDLGWTFCRQERYVEARRELSKVLECQRRRLGLEHPSTLNTHHNLAAISVAQSDYKGARQQSERLLEIKSRCLGADNVSTMMTRHQLAVVLQAEGEVETAIREYKAVLGFVNSHLGLEHPKTLRVRYCLAVAFELLGDCDAAQREFEAVVRLEGRCLGPEHPTTLSTRHRFADFLKSQGRLEEAMQEYREVLGFRREFLGPDHPHTLSTERALAELISERHDPHGEEEPRSEPPPSPPSPPPPAQTRSPQSAAHTAAATPGSPAGS